MEDARQIIESASAGRNDLGPNRIRPTWLERQHALPFRDLSDDEFEVFSYLLLLRERPAEQIIYYGKTADGGRDVVRKLECGSIELIQCKRYSSNVRVGDVRAELAKLCTNVFQGVIPVAPARVVFYAVPDLTSPSKDLLGDRDRWLAECEAALEKHLGEPPSPTLLEFARTWWPEFDHVDEHKLTERARKHQELIEEFFAVRHVLTGSLDALEPRLADIEHSLKRIDERTEGLVGGGLAPPSLSSSQGLGQVSSAGHPFQLRILSEKVNWLEDLNRQHLDKEGQQLVDEIQGSLRALDFRNAAAAAPRLEAWLGDSGSRSSPSTRARIAGLLADLAIIAQVESNGDKAVTTTVARRWYARAIDELGPTVTHEDATRLAALDAKIMSLEGKDSEALQFGAAAPDDPACMTVRLSVLIDQKRFQEAIDVCSQMPLHERWCDRLVIAHLGVGDSAAAENLTGEAKCRFDLQTHRRCLLALSQGRLQNVLASWPEAQNLPSPTPPDAAARSLRTALDDLRPILVMAETNERVSNGIEAEAVACALFCARLLRDRERTATLAHLLGTRQPIHLEYARAAFRGDISAAKDLPDRLREDYPELFEANLLASLLSSAVNADAMATFTRGLNLVRLARTEWEKLRAVEILFELAAEVPEGDFEQVEQIATETFGLGHRLTRLVKSARLLREDNLGEAAVEIEATRDVRDPLWLQIAAVSALQAGDDAKGADHLLAASHLIGRPEVLERAAHLAVKLGLHEEAAEVLDRLVAIRPDDLHAWRRLAGSCVQLGRHGEAARAFAELRRLEPDLAEHGLNHVKCLALAGRREEAVRVLTTVCDFHPNSLEDAAGRAHLLDVLGESERAFASLHSIREAFWSNPQVLMLYVSLGYSTGQDEEAGIALARLIELHEEGHDTPLLSFNLEELVEVFRDHRRARETVNLAILRGRFPWLAAGRIAGRAALADWAYRTQELLATSDHPQIKAEFGIYATNGWAVRENVDGKRQLHRIAFCPKAGNPIVADLSAIITLYHLRLLDKAAAYFGRILLPSSNAEVALTELPDYRPHQLSRLNAARTIREAINRGKIATLPPETTEPLPVLDEYTEAPAYRLSDVVAWLHEAGYIDERREGELRKSLPDRDRGISPAPTLAKAACRGVQTTVATLEAAIRAELLLVLLSSMRIYLHVDEIDDVRTRLLASEFQADLARDHDALWNAIQSDGRFEFVGVEDQSPTKSDEGEERIEVRLQAPLLAELQGLPLLTDDRASQAIALNKRLSEACPAFGTDCLLIPLANAGALTDDELADAFLTLIRWRYRFLVPPVRALVALAVRHRNHPPGRPLREISRYIHDCFADPGLLAGAEPVDHSVSVASASYGYWAQHVGRFVLRLWHDERFNRETARKLMKWAFSELLPSAPQNVHRMKAFGVCQSTTDQVLTGILAESLRYREPERSATAIEESIAALGLSNSGYQEFVGDFLDLLSTQFDGGNDPREVRTVAGLLASIALSPMETISAWAFIPLDRMGILNCSPVSPSLDKLAAILDSEHELRVPNPPGPIVLLRVPGEEQGGEAVRILEYVLYPSIEVRDTAIRYLEAAPGNSSSWLTPRSREALVNAAEPIRSQEESVWYPAAKQLVHSLECDFLLNLSGFRQSLEANLTEEREVYWKRIIRPGIHLFASIPTSWYDLPTNDSLSAFADECVLGVFSLADVLERYVTRYGHLRLASPASAGCVVRHWIGLHPEEGVWETVWAWADAGTGPLRFYHACQVFFECPHLVPEDKAPQLWERVRRLEQSSEDQDDDTEIEFEFRKVGWETRRALARQYLGQLELFPSDLPGDRLAALAWWAAERVSNELTELLETAEEESARWLHNAIKWRVSREAELTGIAWDMLRAPPVPSTFAFGTMEFQELWIVALLSSQGPALSLSAGDEQWIASILFVGLMAGFPLLQSSERADQVMVLDASFDQAVNKWAPQLSSESDRQIFHDLVSLRKGFLENGGLLEAVHVSPDAGPNQQIMVCNTFRSQAALGQVHEADAWGLVTDSSWLRKAAVRLELGPLESTLRGLLEVQRRTGGRWHWEFPHTLCTLVEELDVPPERRRLLAFAIIRSALIGGAMSAVRRLLSGSHQAELEPSLEEWREQFAFLKTVAPPLVAAQLRSICAMLGR